MAKASPEQVRELRHVSGLPIKTCADALNSLPPSERDALIAKAKANGLFPPTLMPRNHEHNPDPNANAARIVREVTVQADSLPADVEAAWAAWSAHIQNVDNRTLSLLRAAFEAAFEAGYVAGSRNGSSSQIICSRSETWRR